MEVTGQKERVVLDNFQHMSGKHCETTSLQKVLNYYGYEFEEEYLFGIAGGAGFINWFRKGMDIPFIGMRNGRFPEFLESVCGKLNIEIEILKTSSVKKSSQQLRDILKSGNPVIAYGDIGALPYFATNGHFGYHAFVVYGIDYEKELVYISDRGGKPQEVSLECYYHAHSVKTPLYSPNNALLHICDINMNNVEMDSVLKDSMIATSNAMLYPPLKKFGISGIKFWANQIREYEKYLGTIDIVDYLVATFSNLELSGTGGKGFREMYSRFLELAQKECSNPHLKDLSEGFREDAKKWRDLAMILLPEEYFGDLSKCLLRKEELFQQEGNYENDAGQELLALIQQKIMDAREYRSKIMKHLPVIYDKIMECYELENQLFTELKSSFKKN